MRRGSHGTTKRVLVKGLSFSFAVSSVLSLAFLLVLVALVSGARVQVIPTGALDPGVIAANGSFAFDLNTATFANVTAGASGGNFSFLNYTNGSGAVAFVDLFFDLETSGFVDDRWAIEHSYDNGTTWNVQRSFGSANLPRQVLFYQDVDAADVWNWTEITGKLRTRIRYSVVGAPDAAARLLLYETWANVTVDTEGPNVVLNDPTSGHVLGGGVPVSLVYYPVDQYNGLGNCSLYLDGAYNQTNLTPMHEAQNAFTVSPVDGPHNWSVACYDDVSPPNLGQSETWDFTYDLSPPIISLVSPQNRSTASGGGIVALRYAVQDWSNMTNCSLYLNGTLNQTLYGLDALWPSGEAEFLIALGNGNWSWRVNCSDLWNYTGVSASSWFLQNANDAPRVHAMNVTNPVVLSLGTNVTVWCNASVSDSQGQGTIDTVTAYLHRSDWPYDRADEKSGHHTSASCDSVGVNSTTIDYRCSFSLPYYARGINWTCTYVATDTDGAEGVGTTQAVVEPLYAFDLVPAYISYGTVRAGNDSLEQNVSIRNLGNSEIDMALDGYAQADGDGLALVCDVGNTTIGNERYQVVSGLSWSVMTPLTDNATQVDLLDLPPRNESFDGEAALYWRIRMGRPLKGNCSGFVTFTGVQS